ncbi:phosphoglycerate mutase-like protein [Lentinus tigrinus ALCF2SS1-7]|uniref:Phosphoglycerate mutase-like protein n=1 Tax=Lentinus tigrinus ALCF2SS1-6 TaxID=1328759 RepID=A0A5C2SBP7_9APHY|nr:phosphoglycerate mutase-like protein [Lentinus tigrinus ALCF2SS1-6]RPD75275.1 phosphoglycerate mutase-like protein [Lentinus tigrinus ALCF2SS1-7]
MKLLAIVHVLAALVALARAAPSEPRSFDYTTHLGNLSPYFKPPVPSGIKEALPDDCKVDQVMLMHRHGSRYPLASELVYITELVEKLSNATAAIKKARLPDNLAFLKDGYASTLGHDDLTAPGRMELFQHGVDFRLKYPHLQVDSILAGLQDRVVESAQWFALGYFGRSWASLNTTMFSTIAEDAVTQSWITPMDTCKDWQYAYGNNATIEWGSIYLPPIAKRLNKLLPGVNLTTDNVHGALYACAYDLAALGTSPWCGAFTSSELLDFEYELDLLMDGAFGYNLPGDMGPVLGSLFVKKLAERFTNSTKDAKPVYLEFGHDTTIDMALTALGLAKDKPALSAKGPARSSRKFRTSLQVPFAAQMLWEKFSCTASFEGPQIRLVLNDAPFPLATCRHMDRKYGSCALDDFVVSHADSIAYSWGDARWNATCGGV